jgi:hypothetical protein
VKPSLQCVGDIGTSTVTVTNLFSSKIPVNTVISFSIINFFAPPTNQPIDNIIITSQSSNSYNIDSCGEYVSGLIPSTIPSSQFIITSNTGSQLTVNQQYTIRLNITTIDIINQLDYFTLTFPTGSVVSLISANINSNVGINKVNATFSDPTLTMYMAGTAIFSAPK